MASTIWRSSTATAARCRSTAELEAEAGGFIIGSFYWTAMAASDVNGDGFADILVEDRAQYQSHDARIHVIFGGLDLHGLDLSQPAAFDGFTITRDGAVEFSVGSGRDVNGDGRDDIVLVSTYTNDTVVLFGKRTWRRSPSRLVRSPRAASREPSIRRRATT
jgi:hypothetical protein